MAIEYLDGGRITGLSTDVKPDRSTSDTVAPITGWNVSVQAGSVFIETDTGKKYVHNGTAWIQQSFDSLNSAFGKSGGIQRQHFIDWCSGKQRNSDYWGYLIQGGLGTTVAGSITFPDEPNGGMQIMAGNDSQDKATVAFVGSTGSSGTQNPQTIRPFDPYGCTCIFVSRHNGINTPNVAYSNPSNFNATCEGFNMNGGVSVHSNGSAAFLSYTFWTPAGKYRFIQADGTGTTATGGSNSAILSSSQKLDGNAHAFKIECLPKKVNYSVDGVLEATGTSYTPTEKMGLNFGCQSAASVLTNFHAAKINLTYVEAWNH